ncbi:MAG: 2-oxo acid dehydrogenase subunit E2 [Cytophagales bacterium]|nr:MAG: 2-oxo acid dehydrogenase subunit E2 [Cytophagales bacterium]TAF62343.1 MAG: 2-oxo acid dehydrogenase subunit E2 [Cytophagales bacterium]
MAEMDICMPKIGESVNEAKVINWLKKVGDHVKLHESILEVATDKVDSEVVAEAEGVLVALLCQVGETIHTGQVLARLDTNAKAHSPASQTVQAAVSQSESAVQNAPSKRSGRFYSPLVKAIAEKEQISDAELSQIQGSGEQNRLTKSDLLAYLAKRSQAGAQSPQQAQKHEIKPDENAKGLQVMPMPGDELIEMDRMRKLIADHMVMSKQVSPHVTAFSEADLSNLVWWRERVKNDFEQKYKEKLTFTPIFVEAIVKAIQDFPLINASISGQTIIKRAAINIGMAAALPNGNLIVPVIKHADSLNLVGLARQVNLLADKARKGQLKPDDIQEGTFTLSNVGAFGNIMGTPIINQPQVAILATGIIKKRPAVVKTQTGYSLGIADIMYLSLSFDHRVVDGALGGRFVSRVAEYLENFDTSRDI